MTRDEWERSTDGLAMLRHAASYCDAHTLRRIAIGNARAIWHLIPDGVLKEAVEFAEQLVTNRVDETARIAMCNQVIQHLMNDIIPKEADWFRMSNRELYVAYHAAKLTVVSDLAMMHIPAWATGTHAPGSSTDQFQSIWVHATRLSIDQLPDCVRSHVTYSPGKSAV